MASDLSEARSLTPLVEHLRRKVDVSDREALAIGGEIADAILRFEDTWDAEVELERARLEWTLDGLDRAMAGILALLRNSMGVALPYASEVDIWAWLHLDDDPAKERLVGEISDPRVKSLWQVREQTIDEIAALDEIAIEVDLSRPQYIAASSRLSPKVRHFLEDLCRIWLARVGELAVVNQADPDGPLLRFVDACLLQAMGDDRPNKGTVRNFIRLHLRDNLEAAPSINERNFEDVETSAEIFALRFHGD